MPNRKKRRQRARERAARDQRRAAKLAARAGVVNPQPSLEILVCPIKEPWVLQTSRAGVVVEHVEHVETTPTPTVDKRARHREWKRARELRNLAPEQLAELERKRAERAAMLASLTPEQRAEREQRNAKLRNAKQRRKMHGLLTPEQRLEVQRKNIANALAARMKRPSPTPPTPDEHVDRIKEPWVLQTPREAKRPSRNRGSFKRHGEHEAHQRAVLGDSLQEQFIRERGNPAKPIVMGAAVLRWQYDVARNPADHPPMHDSNGNPEIARVYVDDDGVLTLCDYRTGDVLNRYQLPPKDKIEGRGPEAIALALIEL